MPNNITNRLRIKGNQEDIKEVLDFIKRDDEENTIDFRKITPVPRWVYGASEDVTGISMQDEIKYGRGNTILDWARNNWGTKWNAYSQPDRRSTEDTIYFETAWNGVPNLIKKIAWIFPSVEIEYSYCDEDFGCNLGRYKFKDTEVIEIYLPKSRSKEAYELGLDIEQCEPSEKHIRFNPNIDNYEYFDED